jgi:multidrug resistance protein, MATE family
MCESQPDETTHLLNAQGRCNTSHADHDHNGTTWQHEGKVLLKSAAPLICAFLLQNSLTLVSTFTIGHVGKQELGAVALGYISANVTGYSVVMGLATSLDTLCAQAYGAGRMKVVGLHVQRNVCLLWCATLPIAVLWVFGTRILQQFVPADEDETANLAGRYLKIAIFGMPGYACFESGKRFVQAQGQFRAVMYVLLIAAPINALLHWLLVWVRSKSSKQWPTADQIVQ